MKFLSILLLLLLGCQKKGSVIILDEPKAHEPEKPRPEYLIDSVAIKGKIYTVVQQPPLG